MTLACPVCARATVVYNTRTKEGRTWRRRRCSKCSYRFSTYEIIEGDAPPWALRQIGEAARVAADMAATLERLHDQLAPLPAE